MKTSKSYIAKQHPLCLPENKFEEEEQQEDEDEQELTIYSINHTDDENTITVDVLRR